MRPRFARNLRPSNERACGMPGARCTRSPVCEVGSKKCTRVFTAVAPKSSGIPHAMVYGLYVISPVIGFLATVIPEKLASQELDASAEASGPHDFAIRFSVVRPRHLYVHRSPFQRS